MFRPSILAFVAITALAFALFPKVITIAGFVHAFVLAFVLATVPPTI
jgi:hypothetical protein